jgi:multiple sugar transport system substrate-binding protein
VNYKQIIYVALTSVLIITFISFSLIFSPSEGSSNSDSVVTTIHYVSHISDAHQKVIDRFNKKYEGRIQIESINLPFEKFSTNERKELLARYLRSKSDRIDVFTVDQIWVPRFTKWSLNLEKYFTRDERKKLLEYGMQTCVYNESLVAVPLYIDVSVMYYREDLLSSIPKYITIKQKIEKSISWIDLININNDMEGKSNSLFVFPADDYEGLMCMFVELMEGQGKSLIEEKKIQLSSSEARRSLQLMVDLVNKYRIAPREVINYRENESYLEFLTNNGVFVRGWPALLIDFSKFANENNVANKIGMAPTPHFENEKSVSVFGGWNLMISKFSPHIDESIIFIKYLLSEEAQKILHQEGGYLPINNLIYENEQTEELLLYQRLMVSGVHRPFLENYTKISDIIALYLNKAINQELSVDEALSSAESKIISENIEIR